MKKISLLACFFMLFFSLSIVHVKAEESKPSVTVKINGLVCDFCAVALEKTFKKEDSVKKIDVNLTSKEVGVFLKSDQAISDERLEELIIKAGYNVVEIKRDN